MYYSTVEEYINEEYIQPIKLLLKKGKTKEAYNLVKLLGIKYLETNECAKSYETYLTSEQLQEGYKIYKERIASISIIEFDKLPRCYLPNELKLRNKMILNEDKS